MPISLQGFGAGFGAVRGKFIGPIWWLSRRSFIGQAPETLPWAQGLLSLNPKKWTTREFFVEISNCSKLNLRPNSRSFFFFFSRFPCVFASSTFRSCPFRAPPVEVGKQLPKAPATKRVGTSRSGLRFWWPNFFSWWGWFSSGTVFSKFHKLGYIQRKQKTLHLWLVKRMPMRQGLGSGKVAKEETTLGCLAMLFNYGRPSKNQHFWFKLPAVDFKTRNPMKPKMHETTLPETNNMKSLKLDGWDTIFNILSFWGNLGLFSCLC